MQIEELLELSKIALLVIMVLIVGLLIVLAIIWAKNKANEDNKTTNSEIAKKTTNTMPSGDKQSIFNFMEFDSVDDNMIIQKDGTRFLMVIECQGVNYDLMSNMEKVGVEEGFVQFLNTLRNPIQIYMQTRSVNLESSISAQKEKLRKQSHL